MSNFPLASTLALGLIYGLVAIGVYLTFRISHFPDLTVDGSFGLGAAVVAVLLTHNLHPLYATVMAFSAGLMAGGITGILQVRLRILDLLAGILTMTALYSINIRIMGKPNIALFNMATLFSENFPAPWIILSIVISIILCVAYFLHSQYGLAIRLVGQNPRAGLAYGVNAAKAKIVMLALSNGLIALAGALFAQLQGFADVSLGTGTIITGLAAIIIGETLIHTHKLLLALISCVIGAVVYRLIIALALQENLFGLQASDLNLVTTGLIILILSLSRVRQMIKLSR